MERGWLDITVDPARYRLALPGNLARRLGAVLPREDLILVLDAPASVIHARKPELEPQEITRQLKAWKMLASQHPSRFAVLDVTETPAAVSRKAYEAIVDRKADTQFSLASCAAALDCLGAMSVAGQEYTVIRSGQRVRWLVPARGRTRGPMRTGLHRPATLWGLPRSLALEAAVAVGRAVPFRRVRLDTRRGLAPILEEMLDSAQLDISAAATGDPARGDRAVCRFIRTVCSAHS